MADGSLRPIEDVVVGDLMMGPDSKPRTVVGLFRGVDQMYLVKQTSANDYMVNGAHVLVLRKSRSCALDRGELMPSGNWRRSRGRYADWSDEVEITVEDWLRQSKRWKEMFRGFRAGCLAFPERDVPVDPYLLGVWLGDGLHRELMVTSADAEIVDWLREFALNAGLTFTAGGKLGNAAKDYRIGRNPSVHGRVNPVWAGFKVLGVVSNKHIPEAYIVNAENVRLKLLAGLIDTDGTFDKRGTYNIALANQRLAKDVKRLADSLGFRTSFRRKDTICTNNGVRGKAWSVGISGDLERVPCLVERKRVAVGQLKPNKDKMLSQVSIESVGVGEYFGVELDGDKRFLLADGTVTHNSGKSWAFARMALLEAVKRPLRVLCAREFQVSIGDSVHHLLADQIERMGLSEFFSVGESFIRGANGSEFLFRGLRRNPTGIKSMEDVGLCWVEEAQDISEASWEMLTPTIRAPGSEIWVTFNPNEATDPTYRRFVAEPMPGVVSRKVNWNDNPNFPPELELERAWMAKTDPDAYSHVWEGNCIQASDAQVLRGKITIEPFEPKPDWHGPYYGADWGFSQDPTTLVRAWIADKRLWVEHEAYGVGVEIDHTPALFDRVPGARNQVIRADSARPETISYMNRNGYSVQPAPKWDGSVKDGVAHLRGYEQIVLHSRCRHAAEEARLWKFKTDRLTGDVLTDLAPGNDHIWDAVRYALAPVIQRRDVRAAGLKVSGL